MKRMIGLTALAVVLACGTANAQQLNVKIGVLTDMSSLYADATGIWLGNCGQDGRGRLHERPS